MADTPDPELGQLLKEAGVRVYFDRGNDCTKPCTFCGTRPVSAHKLLRIGIYPNGDPIRRPVCDQCQQVVEARAKTATPATLPGSVCPDCRMLRCLDGQPWDIGTHCPSTAKFEEWQGLAKLVAERDCLAIGLAKARANEQRMIATLRTVQEALDSALAEHAQEVGRG